MHPLITEKKPQFEAAVDWLSRELSTVRTGRATPAIVEGVKVSAYGSEMELKGVASITNLDAKTLVIDPWDKQLLQAIEKAIRNADLGLSPAVDGQIIRIVMPPMTEENRKQLAKVVKERLEEARIRIRAAREQVRDLAQRMEKDKEIGEDEKFKAFDEIDKLTKDYVARVEEMGRSKEEEIMTI